MKLRLAQPISQGALDQAQREFREQCRVLGMDDMMAGLLTLAFNEVGTNVMEHSQSTWFEAAMDLEDGRAVLTFRDDGEAFDSVEAMGLFDVPVPEIDRHMGLYMLGRMPFEKCYRRLDGGTNELVLRQRVC